MGQPEKSPRASQISTLHTFTETFLRKKQQHGVKITPQCEFSDVLHVLFVMLYISCCDFFSTRSGGKPANMRGYMISYPLAIQDVWLAN